MSLYASSVRPPREGSRLSTYNVNEIVRKKRSDFKEGCTRIYRARVPARNSAVIGSAAPLRRYGRRAPPGAPLANEPAYECAALRT
ncbi:hypothetical protein EVAR_20850_1 [Eumeta japonica]|uniref:Uncharacterized protein n=1 Tax=Eumeta variegata TaxID=151549 RepID=A0A4C1UF01_EUMVA|nr:hypothetical protein EVAR_20850_1 [Eumeta japonica]